MATAGEKKIGSKNYLMYKVGPSNALTLIGCLTDFSYKHTVKTVETMCQELGLETEYTTVGHTRSLEIGGISFYYTPAQVTAGSWGFEEWEAAANSDTTITVAVGKNTTGTTVKTFVLHLSEISEDTKVGDQSTYKVSGNIIGAPGTITLP